MTMGHEKKYRTQGASIRIVKLIFGAAGRGRSVGGICAAARKYACLVPIRRKVGGRGEREGERETCHLGWHWDGTGGHGRSR